MKEIKSGRKETVKETQEHNLSVMKPFIKFGFGALKLLAHTLIFIVKAIPKPEPEKPTSKTGSRVIKIK
jgi:hypothetical protein